jgi:DnaJ-class molecular chaperone
VAQQTAVDCLVAAGATLAGDFSDAELRRAFRLLARQYHPDRHPGAPAAEHARLSRQFASILGAYRELQTTLPKAA